MAVDSSAATVDFPAPPFSLATTMILGGTVAGGLFPSPTGAGLTGAGGRQRVKSSPSKGQAAGDPSQPIQRPG